MSEAAGIVGVVNESEDDEGDEGGEDTRDSTTIGEAQEEDEARAEKCISQVAEETRKTYLQTHTNTE